LLNVIGEVKDFPDEKRLASYFGIVPRVANSNQTEHSGRIHKRGTKTGPHGSGAICNDLR
jgi:transposase